MYTSVVILSQVSIVGDFSEEDIESCILDYLGTVRATRNSKDHQCAPVVFRPSPSHFQSQQVRGKANLLVNYIVHIAALSLSLFLC